MKIKIKVIQPETVHIFDPKGNSCGDLNESEYLDLRCQIKHNKVSGFYFYYEGEKVQINKYGALVPYVPIFTSNIDKVNYLLGLNGKLFKTESGRL